MRFDVRSLCLLLLMIPMISWGGVFGQKGVTLQRFLEENPGQQALLDQLAVRVHSLPAPINSLQTATLQIGVIFSGSDSDIENKAWLIAFKRRMQILRIDYRLDVYYLPSGHDARDVVRAFDAVGVSRFDYLVIDSVTEYLRPELERVLKRDYPKVIMLNVSTPFRVWRFHPPLVYIGVDYSQSMGRLASYLDRRLSNAATIDVVTVEDAYLYDSRCSTFVNALEAVGRSVRDYYIVADSSEEGYRAAMSSLDHSSLHIDDEDTGREQFIFACTPNISLGVWEALKAAQVPYSYTNSWSGQAPYPGESSRPNLLVTVLGMHDNMAIATAEVVKAHMESRLSPMVYAESSQLITQEMDEQTLNIIYEQAFIYSRPLWPQ